MAHAQLTQVNSSPLPSAIAHRLHQPVFNQSSQPSIGQSVLYKSPPPPPSPTPNNLALTGEAYASGLRSQGYFLNPNLSAFAEQQQQLYDQTVNQQQHYDQTLNQQQHLYESPYEQAVALPYEPAAYESSYEQAVIGQIPAIQAQQFGQPYITPKYARSNFTNKKLPVIDCGQINSMNPMLQQQATPFQQVVQQSAAPIQQYQSVRNPLASFVAQKSPPSSGSSLETNSPRSATQLIQTTINSSSSGSPHPVHQAQSAFHTAVQTTNSGFTVSSNVRDIGMAGQQASGGMPTANLINSSLGAMGKVLSDLVSSETRSAAIQELRETVYRYVDFPCFLIVSITWTHKFEEEGL